MGKGNKKKSGKQQGPADSGSQQSSSGGASENKKKDQKASGNEKNQPKPKQHQPSLESQPSSSGSAFKDAKQEQDIPRPTQKSAEVPASVPEEHKSSEAEFKEWKKKPRQRKEKQPQGSVSELSEQKPALKGAQQQPSPGQQQQPSPGQQQQPRPGQQQQPQWPVQQQQPRPGQQQQPQWPVQQQQPRPGQQQQPQWPVQQQQPRPGQQQQPQWPGQQQQPQWPGQQQQPRPGQQQQPRPGHQQQPQWPGQQQQPRPGQQQPQWPGQQQQPRPGQQQQPSPGQQPTAVQHQQLAESVKQQQPTKQDRKPTSTVALPSAGPSQIHERGTHGTKFVLETNYLTLDLKKMPDVAYHYDVKIELYNTDPKKIKEPPKKFLRLAFEAYVKKLWPKYALAYDGKASAYSAQKLPEDELNANEGALITAKIEEDRELQFIVTLKATLDIEVDLSSLKTYQKDRIFDKPMRALQCIEVVLRTPCHEKGVRGGRSFFTPPRQKLDLGDGYELWYGLYQAAMLCDTPLLNVDVSHKSFPSEVNIVQFYRNQRYMPDEGLKEFLKGLTVIYNPPKCFNATSKRYKFNDVLSASSRQMLNLEGKKMTVAEYFSSKGYRLQYPDLPCLHIGSTMKNIYIPLELITVPPGQAILRKDNDTQIRNMISFAATSTIVRKEKIMELLRRFEYYAHPTVERFGITVGRDFIKVEARFLEGPRIEYRQGKKIRIERPGEWMARNANFLKCGSPAPTFKWAILNYSTKINKIKLDNGFVSLVSQAARQMGMCLEPKCTDILDFHKPENLKDISIREELMKMKKRQMNIIFVILPIGRSEQYSKIKQAAEISCGVVTQCIKSDTIYKETRQGPREINSMTVNNILLKVNAKLNGTNHKIADESNIALQKKSKIMFVGADVSHPSPLQKDIPSIVGVVASHDSNGTQYNMQYRLQEPGEETIMDMKDIFHQHLLVYQAHMGHFPDTIIYYRDGVSDGQFKDIENVEINAMRTACKMVNCKAKFTCIIVVKRHHTRFFPKPENAEGKFSNVQAGTVVDRTIIHPGEEQFFMVSHKAIQGTSKPTRYNVIVDESKIPINDLQTLTYNLCHLFPRCNRAVSYPAPAYLSHLVGLRGRAYIHGSNLNLKKLKDEYSKRCISKDMKSNPMYFV